MIYDDTISFVCNGVTVTDIKVSTKLNSTDYGLPDDLLSDEYTYVRTTTDTLTNVFETNSENSCYSINYERITGYTDGTNTLDVEIKPIQNDRNIYLCTDLDRPNTSYNRAKNRSDSAFNARLISFNPNNYCIKVAGFGLHNLSGDELTASCYDKENLSEYDETLTRIRYVYLVLCDMQGHPVTCNGKQVTITYLYEHINADGKSMFMYAPYFNATNNQTCASGFGTGNYGVQYNPPVTTYGNNVPAYDTYNLSVPCLPFSVTAKRENDFQLVEGANGADYFVATRKIQTRHEMAIYNMFTIDAMKRTVASLGLFFIWENTLHMPVIHGSITDGTFVTGADIETTDSDIKTYKETQGHTPVYPDHEDDDIELSMPIGNIYSASGLVKYYLLSDSTKLTEISNAMSDVDIVPTGKDLLPNLISLKRFCVDKSLIGRGMNKTIKIAGVELKDDDKGINATGETLDSTQAGIDLGTITINGKYGSENAPHYLDFAPYTELQLYLPLCGWIDLPSKCMYKTLSIYYVFDCISGSCIATVKAGETIVATATGSLGVDIPFTATSAGIQFAGKLNGLINGAGSVLTGIAGVATGNPLAIGASILSGASAITNGITTANKNYTQVTGRTGDISEWGLMNAPYLKISRPIINKPTNFAHTIGNLCCKQSTLESMTGYTIVDNPDISVECTSGELEEIKALLTSGIYI